MNGVFAAIFCGGIGRRMGGIPKGLLEVAPGVTLIDHLCAKLQPLDVPVVLVGAGDAYRSIHLPQIPDDPAEIGPLGGLAGLVRCADTWGTTAIVVACDMPAVTASLVARLLTERAGVPALAPRRSHGWEPLFARYDLTALAIPAAEAIRSGDYALQRLLDRIGASELALSEDERDKLLDWDRWSDLPPDAEQANQRFRSGISTE